MTEIKASDLYAEYVKLLDHESEFINRCVTITKPLLHAYLTDLKQAFAACLENKKYRESFEKGGNHDHMKIVIHLTYSFNKLAYDDIKTVVEDLYATNDIRQLIDKSIDSYKELSKYLATIDAEFRIGMTCQLSRLYYIAPNGEPYTDKYQIMSLINDDKNFFDFSDLRHLI